MSSNVIGAGLSVIALLFGLLTGILVKQVSSDIPIFTILMARFWFSVPLLFLMAYMMRGPAFLGINDKKTLSLRVLFGLSGITFWFLSLRHIPIGLATALFQSSVLFVTLFSPFMLGEQVGKYRWSAVIMGFVGVFIITDPLGKDVPIGIIYGVLCALSGACLAIFLRRLGKTEHPASVASLYNFYGALITSVVAVVIPGQLVMPMGQDLYMLIALGMVGSLLQICFTSAFRFADAVIVAVLRYLQVPGAIIVGYFMFSEVPSGLQMLGTLIVLSSSVFIVLREFYLGKKQKTEAAGKN